MSFDTVWQFIQSFCVLFFITFVFSKLKIIKKHFTVKPENMRDKLILSLLFGALACVGSLIGIEFNGSLVNTRVIGVVAGGLLGGPLVGVLSGVIAAGHRVLLLDTGMTTALVCGASSILEGAFAGVMSVYSHKFKKLWVLAMLTVILCELFRKLMLLMFIKPFGLAFHLVENLTVPMLLINSLGVALFITFIENAARQLEEHKAAQMEIALAMTEEISTSFKKGLIGDNLKKVVKTIEENTDFSDIIITDTSSRIICNHISCSGVPDVAIKELKKKVESEDLLSFIEFSHDGIHFIAAPLIDEMKIAGFILLGKKQSPSIYDYKFAQGLGKLFSVQLTIGNLEYRSSLLKEAEIKVLQTQINPHFLFNSLSVVSSLCRTSPEKARTMIDRLADFYRKNLRINSQFVSVQEEIEHIEAYLDIIKTRYASKIRILYDVDKLLDCYLPPLSLQPLVENSIKHGLLPKKEGGLISIRAKRDKESNAVKIEVEDDGKGFDPSAAKPDDSNLIGLSNVRKRLQNCFGDDLTWQLETKPGMGTRITIIIPVLSNV